MNHANRYWEIDFMRGSAVIMMIIFHVVFDLSFFSIFSISITMGFWRWCALITATLFLFLVGISLTISLSRLKEESILFRYWHSLKRGTSIFVLGLGITVVTYRMLGDGFILFGILHCIGLSVILATPFFGHPRWALISGTICIVGGFIVDQIDGPWWLLWAGVHPASFFTVDYVPLIPWFGVVLLGMSLGSILYPNGSPRFFIPRPFPALTHPIIFLGRHSLAIYIIHQPVILVILHLVFPGFIWVFF